MLSQGYNKDMEVRNTGLPSSSEKVMSSSGESELSKSSREWAPPENKGAGKPAVSPMSQK